MSKKDLSRIVIFDAINQERQYQTEKWGTLEEHPHTIPEYVMIMEKELAEAKEAYFQSPATWADDMLLEILQVIAVGVACLEQFGVVGRHREEEKA